MTIISFATIGKRNLDSIDTDGTLTAADLEGVRGSHHQKDRNFYAIVGDGDKKLEEEETAYKLADFRRGRLDLTDNSAVIDHPVSITAHGRLSNGSIGDLSHQISFNNKRGFGLDNGPDSAGLGKFMNSGDSITFETQEFLGTVSFTAMVRGGGEANVLIDFDGNIILAADGTDAGRAKRGQEIEDAALKLENVADGASIEIDFTGRTVLVDNIVQTGSAIDAFFTAFDSSDGQTVTIGGYGGAFAINDLQLEVDSNPINNVPENPYVLKEIPNDNLPEKLLLTSFGRTKDDVEYGDLEGPFTLWRIRNGFDDDREVTLDGFGSDFETTLTVPANTETFLVSTFVGVHSTHRLFFEGDQVQVKAASPGMFNFNKFDTSDPAVAPTAVDDGPIFIEEGDVLTTNVFANDIGDINPATMVVTGADAGRAVNLSGNFRYEADTFADNSPYDFAQDTVQYTVDDVFTGETSNTANVVVNVVNAGEEVGTDDRAASNGQDLSLKLTTEEQTLNTTSDAIIEIDVGSFSSGQVNVSFIVDESGSIGTTNFNAQLAVIQAGIDRLRDIYDGTGTNVFVQLVEMHSGSTSQVFNLNNAVLDDVSTGTLYSNYNGGFTNYEAALQEAFFFFDSAPDGGNNMLFLSDGDPRTSSGVQPTSAFADELLLLDDLDVARTALGFGSGLDPATTALNDVDNTGGPELFTNITQLDAAFQNSALFPADLVDFDLSVNGNSVADMSDLLDAGIGSYYLGQELLGLDNSAGAINSVVATATFDTDNDGVGDEVRTVENLIEGIDIADLLSMDNSIVDQAIDSLAVPPAAPLAQGAAFTSAASTQDDDTSAAGLV